MAAGTYGYRNQLMASKVIHDENLSPSLAIHLAGVAALERIEVQSRYIWHELADNCSWIKRKEALYPTKRKLIK